MIDYFLTHLALAMAVILVAGIIGVVVGDPSPHPVPMVWCGMTYLGFYFVYKLTRLVFFALSIMKH